jgi:hypothetical protein
MSASEQAELGGAASNIAGQWADRDPRAAEIWVRSLPKGAARDEGLNGLIQRAANRGSIDSGLFDEFSSPEARARGVMFSMFSLGRNDPDLARQLIAEYIPDPRQRQQAEQMLDTAARMPSALGALPAALNIAAGSIVNSGSGGLCVLNNNGNTVIVQC